MNKTSPEKLEFILELKKYIPKINNATIDEINLIITELNLFIIKNNTLKCEFANRVRAFIKYFQTEDYRNYMVEYTNFIKDVFKDGNVKRKLQLHQIETLDFGRFELTNIPIFDSLIDFEVENKLLNFNDGIMMLYLSVLIALVVETRHIEIDFLKSCPQELLYCIDFFLLEKFIQNDNPLITINTIDIKFIKTVLIKVINELIDFVQNEETLLIIPKQPQQNMDLQNNKLIEASNLPSFKPIEIEIMILRDTLQNNTYKEIAKNLTVEKKSENGITQIVMNIKNKSGAKTLDEVIGDLKANYGQDILSRLKETS